MSKARLAPALQVFQTLQRYPIIRPRRQPDVPIGCVSPSLSAQAAQQSILSLYHDLGVLVFAGCSASQTERIGDILRQVVNWGGPGGAITSLTTGQHTHKRVDELPARDLHDTLDEARVSFDSFDNVEFGQWLMYAARTNQARCNSENGVVTVPAITAETNRRGP